MISLAEAWERISSWTDLPPARRRDLRSSLRAIEKVIGRDAAFIPFTCADLRAGLHDRPPRAAGINERRWNNVLSDLRHVLRRLGLHEPHHAADAIAGTVWERLLEEVPDQYHRLQLTRFLASLATDGIEPDDVADEQVERFLDLLQTRTLDPDPHRTVRQVVTAWNATVDSTLSWPRAPLTSRRRRSPYCLQLADFPADFQIDVEAWLASIGTSPLALGRRRRAGGRSEHTIEAYRFTIRQCASALVLSGRPSESIRSLADLVEPEAAAIALEFLCERQRVETSSGPKQVAERLLAIARHHCKVPPEQVAKLKSFVRELTPLEDGMSRANQDRMRALAEDGRVDILIQLPFVLMREADGWGAGSTAGQLAARAAAAVMVLLSIGLRRQNLVELRLDANLHRRERLEFGRLSIPADRVKNRQALDYPLDADTDEILGRYVRDFRSRSPGAASPWLFPAAVHAPEGAGDHLSGNAMLAHIKQVTARNVGVPLTLHAFRHADALAYLQDHPGDYEGVRRLLAHKGLQTTMKHYVWIDHDKAHERYMDTLAARRRDPLSGGPGRRGR